MNEMNQNTQVLLIYGILILLVVPSVVVSECTCDESKEVQDKGKSLKLKIAAIISILIASTIGVCIPFLGKLIPAISPEKDIFLLIKAFAAGVILATGFIHVLPDAFENLTSPCLHDHPWGDFPFTGFVAMCTSMGTLMVDAYATAYFQKSHFQEAQVETSTDTEKDLHLHETHAHAHGFVPSKSSELLRHRVISQVLELGIVVHSIVIGITLGASMSSETIRPLVAALTFHQFFEGIGLGSCITQAKFRRLSVIIMGLFFSLTTPIGIAIGIGISNVYDDNSSTALIVEGVFNAASAGILIYMALVDLLAADFMNPRTQKSGKLQIGANISLLLGAGLMTLIAKWA
ncbi:zinc transporter 5-like [Arachis duranensis]|uniref:Zinc transporter 5-like n=1 Tax=Arachis duranensis TaxID=130453 RepID=A0A6P5M613_ARADU|nr:zinc transporter 5-like [Arachis duranensis]